MKKITAVVLLITMMFSFASCGIRGHEAETLDIDIKTGTLEGLTLGMSIEDAKASGVFDADKLGVTFGEDILPYDMGVVDYGQGVTLLGEDSSLQMMFIDGKLGVALFDLNMDMTGRVSDFSEREEFFTQRADIISSALENTLGKPTFCSSGSIKGSVYPGDDDDEAIVHLVYFVKDGKLLSEDELKGSGLMEHYAMTDFDFAVASMFTKSFIASEDSLATRSDAGIITVQISSKKALLMAQSLVDEQLAGKKGE